MNSTDKTGWKMEHPKANVPSQIADHAELEDQSYRNDAMPSFAFKHVEKTPFEIVLYVDYEDKNLSDSPDGDYRRFYVSRQNWEKGSEISLYHGDDMNVALAVTLAAGKMIQTDALNVAVA
jgi:hypothetical protein